MASISTTLELVDHISGRLAAIGGRVQGLAKLFGELDGCISAVQARMKNLDLHAPEWELEPPELTGLEKFEIPEIDVPELVVHVNEPDGIDMMQAGVVSWTAPDIEMPEVDCYELPVQLSAFPGIWAAEADAAGVNGGMLQGLAKEIELQQHMLSGVTAAAANAAVAAAEEVMNRASGAELGADFSTGLAQGIRSGAASVTSAARAVASAAASAARAALDIHSPSRVAQRIGAQFGAGFAEGIAGSGDGVSKATGHLTGIAYRELNSAVRSGVQLFGVLEHAEDDGEVFLNAADLRRLRELAEKEAVQTFTTAELNIEFTANNTINSRLDLDGVVSYLEEQVAEKLALAAEGVYI